MPNQYTKAKELGLKKPEMSAEGRAKLSIIAKKHNAEYWNEKNIQKHSETMRKVVIDHPESYSKNNVSGRVQIYDYKGTKLKGRWELETAKWLDAQDIKWENEANPQNYKWNNGWHLYFPDFYLPDLECYIEVKGYKRERDECKWSAFDGRLIIVDKEVIDQLNDFTFASLCEIKEYAPLA